MVQKDWKDILNKNRTPDPEISSEKPIEKLDTPHLSTRQNLIIRFEKRNGKPATIISNFIGSEVDLKDLAGKIKKHCGVGGSAKDDEILIQGDVRIKVADLLKSMGHTVRGDFKK